MLRLSVLSLWPMVLWAPAEAFGSGSLDPVFGLKGGVLFWGCLLLILILSLLGLILALVHHRRYRNPPPFHRFWAELGWGLVPLLLLWGLLTPLVLEVARPPVAVATGEPSAPADVPPGPAQ